MRLSSKALEEFTIIYRDEFGEAVTDAEATEMALRVFRFFTVVRPPRRTTHDSVVHR